MKRRQFLTGLAASAGLIVVPPPVRRYWAVPSNAPVGWRYDPMDVTGLLEVCEHTPVGYLNADSLAKALEAGYQQGAGKTGGFALRVESLESSLKVVTFNTSKARFWG